VFRNIYLTLFLLICLFTFSCRVFKPTRYLLKTDLTLADKYSTTISAEKLYEYLSILASDDFEGRETTKPGQKKAAKYLSSELEKENIKSPLKEGYFQVFDVDITDFSDVELIINNDTLTFLDNYYSFGMPINTRERNIEIVNVGYGLINNSRNDYQGINVKDKIVLVNEGLPNSKDFSLAEGSWRSKLANAKKEGAKAIIVQKNNYSETDSRIKEHIKYPIMKMHSQQKIKEHIPVFFVDQNFIYKETDQLFASYSTNVSSIATAENVLSFIKGKTEEVIVISAHYDHIGYDQGLICNGADDDGSGTASLLSIAKAFQLAHNDGHVPYRNILFLMVSGEEKGLFGSDFYTKNPVFPLDKTMADLNIDMIGRKDTVQNDDNYIYLIGSDKESKDLHILNEQINNEYVGFRLDYTYNSLTDPNQFFYRSDHYNFAKHNIPVIFYFGGLHEDYHKPTDEVEKIDFSKLEKTTRYIFLTAWELAYRKKEIK